LAESAKEYAEAKGRRVWLEERRKIVKAEAFSRAAGNGTMAEREAMSYQSPDYMACVDELREAVIAEETMRAYRAAADARVETWRTLEASRRAANV
jgi:hypothetical protein